LSAGTGELLPYLTLATPSGAPAALGQDSGRRNLVVVLLGAGSPGEIVARLLGQLVQARATLDEEETEVLVVRPDGAGALTDAEAGPFTVLVDDDALFHRRVGAVDESGRASPALFITDRYREIYHAARPGDAQWPTSAEDVVRWLVFMNIQCPECGAPEW
jgi:hypothetical protein